MTVISKELKLFNIGATINSFRFCNAHSFVEMSKVKTIHYLKEGHNLFYTLKKQNHIFMHITKSSFLPNGQLAIIYHKQSIEMVCGRLQINFFTDFITYLYWYSSLNRNYNILFTSWINTINELYKNFDNNCSTPNKNSAIFWSNFFDIFLFITSISY